MATSDRLPDLNLLRLFVALVEERHVTRAGERLFLSQPAASGGLKRLREQFQDPLLVREGHDLRVTARAQALYDTIAPRLEDLAAAVAAGSPFDPASDSRTFRLGCTDAVAYAILPPLLARLREAAPNCRLAVRIGDFRSLPGLLLHGEIGTALGYLGEELPANARIRVLRHAQWVLLRDPATPPVATLDDYCARLHAMVTPRGELEGFVDALLHQQGRSRRVVLGVSSFGLLSVALPGSDLVTTLPDFVGERLRLRAGLTIEPPPIAPPPLPNALAWSDAQDRDPAERWFRQQVTDAFTGVFGRS
ncbi:LysR substrate-binding domain-containing protein [Roseomonas sp. E05]|uniref:LysR substrate-binding domain-containing protein n=1 Tax=Roseomonas sp. E05 TaxID=3046310 RepID=UPI0024BADD79|nr:LysR substrate-binding domain-containing protein [Roseomonas sp. E05]MDJ0389398.1 LysR substrate-binding domain-containing protein [Roseomonas sp. E05]